MKNKNFEFDYSLNVVTEGQGLYYYENGILKYYNGEQMIDLRNSLDNEEDQELKRKLNHFILKFKLEKRLD